MFWVKQIVGHKAACERGGGTVFVQIVDSAGKSQKPVHLDIKTQGQNGRRSRILSPRGVARVVTTLEAADVQAKLAQLKGPVTLRIVERPHNAKSRLRIPFGKNLK